MRSRFDEELERLNSNMIEMGAFCEAAIETTAAGLRLQNRSTLKDVQETWENINEMQRKIENQCLKLLLQQQPVAKDLRVVTAALKMVTDMKRIGTQSLDIAEIIFTAHIESIREEDLINRMAAETIRMVQESVDAFVKKDKNIAVHVISYDDIVDEYFIRIKSNLKELISQPGADCEVILDMLMIAKYFERIGDHAVNIAKWVLFSITGHQEINS